MFGVDAVDGTAEDAQAVVDALGRGELVDLRGGPERLEGLQRLEVPLPDRARLKVFVREGADGEWLVESVRWAQIVVVGGSRDP